LPIMTTVNIRRDVDDKFYRYKMPLLQTKIEGRGNGIKTVIPNMEDVARALNRPPTCEWLLATCRVMVGIVF
jgi:translation initiation factor 5